MCNTSRSRIRVVGQSCSQLWFTEDKITRQWHGRVCSEVTLRQKTNLAQPQESRTRKKFETEATERGVADAICDTQCRNLRSRRSVSVHMCTQEAAGLGQRRRVLASRGAPWKQPAVLEPVPGSRLPIWYAHMRPFPLHKSGARRLITCLSYAASPLTALSLRSPARTPLRDPSRQVEA